MNPLVHIKTALSRLTKSLTITTVTVISLVGASTETSLAAPSGIFTINKSGSNLYVDVYGDALPKTQGPVHLWDSQTPSTKFILGPSENTGNEIRSNIDQSVCLTPDAPLGRRPADGTAVVARRNCAQSFNWKFEGNRIYLGRFPDVCLDVPENKSNKWQRLTTYTCNGGAAQIFGFPGTFVKPTPTKLPEATLPSKPTIIAQENEFEYWLVADRRTSYQSSLNVGGHVFVSLIKRNVITYSNGQKDYKNWETWKTFGNWGNNQPGLSNGLRVNYKYEFDTVNDILNSKVNGIYSVRKAKVSEGRANWIASNPGYTGCRADAYSLNELNRTPDQCSCVVFATRHWTYFTANWENFQPYGILGRAPKNVADKIDQRNKDSRSEFLDNATIWK